MAKRFTDTTKWDDDWFLALPPRLKSAWEYLRDNCEGAGLMKISFVKMSRDVGEKITREEFDLAFNAHVQWVNENTLWIIGHIGEQFKNLTARNAAHVNMARQILRAIEGIELTIHAKTVADSLRILLPGSDDPRLTLGRPSPEGRARDIGKGFKVKDSREGGLGETSWLFLARLCFQAADRFLDDPKGEAAPMFGTLYTTVQRADAMAFAHNHSQTSDHLRELADRLKTANEEIQREEQQPVQ